MKKKWIIIGLIIIISITAFFIWNKFFKASDESLADQNINININPQSVMKVEGGT